MSLSQKWFHGTEPQINIEAWSFPPPPATHKPELHPHSAVFLTTDKTLAAGAGGKLYSAMIQTSARVLNLLEPSRESEEFRRLLVEKKLGRDHGYAKKEYWVQAWQEGYMMRFGSAKAHHMKDHDRVMAAKQAIEKGSFTSDDMLWLLKAQNLTRAWIEELVAVGREMKFDALIGAEPDTRMGKRYVCPVLFALNSKAITTPVLELN